MRKSKKIFWLFLAPCLITFCIAVVIPTITGIYYSFTDWDGLHSNCDFVFLDNYISAFHDIYFQNGNYNSDSGKCGCICNCYVGNSEYKGKKFI